MKESARIFRFAVIGTLNALIMAVTVWVMMDELDINYMLSNVTAYILAQIHNFIWCKYWIFPTEKKSNTWRQVLLFSIAFGIISVSVKHIKVHKISKYKSVSIFLQCIQCFLYSVKIVFICLSCISDSSSCKNIIDLSYSYYILTGFA